MTKTIRDKKEITQVGTVSGTTTARSARSFPKAMDKVGKEGVITVEEAKSMETTLEIVEGMQFRTVDTSLPTSSRMRRRWRVTLEDPLILLQ
jgi:chaperonin GroEL